jgi:hypothetical protein
MTDLDTQATELSAAFAAKRIPIYCTAGKKAVRFWKASFLPATSGYGISRSIAMTELRRAAR